MRDLPRLRLKSLWATCDIYFVTIKGYNKTKNDTADSITSILPLSNNKHRPNLTIQHRACLVCIYYCKCSYNIAEVIINSKMWRVQCICSINCPLTNDPSWLLNRKGKPVHEQSWPRGAVMFCLYSTNSSAWSFTPISLDGGWISPSLS